MIYDLNLSVSYKYQTPAGTSRHLVRVAPRDIADIQIVHSQQLTIRPQPAEQSVFTDFFGNTAHDLLLMGEHDELIIQITSRVERLAMAASQIPDISLANLPDLIADIHEMGPDSPHHFLGMSPRVRPRKLTTDFARDALSADCSTIEAVRMIGSALHNYLAFDSTATTVDTPLETAFTQRRGVCQDFTHIMIACLRGVGIPAGYVSGVIRTIPPEGQPRLEGADAMHAWVRAWCGPDIGWFEYDPTNAMDVANEHIVIAYGRDYFDVAPTKGVLRTVGQHEGTQSVDLVEVPA